MINISIIVNDSFYKTPTGSSIITGSSINFTSHFGATEILNNHTNIFSIVEPGIVHIKINGSDEDMKFFIFDGMISFLKNEGYTFLIIPFNKNIKGIPSFFPFL